MTPPRPWLAFGKPVAEVSSTVLSQILTCARSTQINHSAPTVCRPSARPRGHMQGDIPTLSSVEAGETDGHPSSGLTGGWRSPWLLGEHQGQCQEGNSQRAGVRLQARARETAACRLPRAVSAPMLGPSSAVRVAAP